MTTISTLELKQRISLTGLFERDHVALKKTGADTWKCCCPFHSESTPSCVVHEVKAFFKCFGCGARGTIFEYWALARGIDGKSKEGFAEVCRQLSELVLGHAVPAPKARPATEVKEPERPVALAGRDLDKWHEGCAWLVENEAEQQKLAEWRGYSVELVKRLAELGKLGMPKYFLSEREHGRLPGLSVECVDEKTGEPYLAGFHVRMDPPPGEKAMWHFVPKGIGSWPFVVGDPRKAAVIVFLEGQWDAIAWIDAMGLGAPIKNTAVFGVRGAGSWEKAFAWSWNHDEGQVWVYADADDAGMKWLHAEEGFAWHLRRRCKALHAGTIEGEHKDFNDLHKAACRRGRAEWTAGLRAMMRRQYERGKRTRKYRPKRERAPK